MNSIQIVVLVACAIAFVTFIVFAALAIEHRKTTKGHRSAALSAGSLVLSLIVGAAAVFVPQESGAEPTARPGPTAKVTSPVGSSPKCVTVKGTIQSWNDKYSLAIAVRETTNDRWYVEGQTSVDQARGTFSGLVDLGDRHDKAGSDYIIQPVFIPRPWHAYLMKTSENAEDTYWSNPDVPPDSIEGEAITVVRTSNRDC